MVQAVESVVLPFVSAGFKHYHAAKVPAPPLVMHPYQDRHLTIPGINSDPGSA